MDVVASINETSIPHVLQPTVGAFMALLNKRRTEIEKFPRRTFQYGSTDRHQLDVYYPSPATVSGGSIPVLFFEYGGGFVQGDRRLAPPTDLAYSNVGAFFGQRGIMVVIADYRLVPHVKYPQPPEDIRDAISWFLSNPSTVLADNPAGLSGTLDITKIVVMGHSAGASHTTTLYFCPTILPLDSPVRAATRGLIPQGAPFSFDAAAAPVFEDYYGSQEAAIANVPAMLFTNAPDALINGLPDMLIMASEREPDFIRGAVDSFVKQYEAKAGKPARFAIMKGHNHISPHWALFSGQGEEWGEEVAAWVKAKF